MLRFGTVGTGWIAESYVEGALKSGLWTLTAVYSRKQETGEAFAAKLGGAKVYTDLAEMAASGEIDAVYIASPNFLHMAHARVFLEHGVHVLCEKPLSARAGELEAVQRLADEKGLVFLEAIMYMHLPQRRLLQDALARIGNVSLAKLDFCQRSSKYDALLAGKLPNIFNPEMETGALMDLGVYCLFPALHLFGLPDAAQVSARLLSTGADGSGVVAMQYADKLVDIVYSKLGQAAANSDFQGDLGTVSVGSISRLADIEIIWNDGTRETVCGEEPKWQLMGYEAQDFHAFITEPEKHAAAYRECASLSMDVCRFTEQLRRLGGIRFPTDRP